MTDRRPVVERGNADGRDVLREFLPRTYGFGETVRVNVQREAPQRWCSTRLLRGELQEAVRARVPGHHTTGAWAYLRAKFDDLRVWRHLTRVGAAAIAVIGLVSGLIALPLDVPALLRQLRGPGPMTAVVRVVVPEFTRETGSNDGPSRDELRVLADGLSTVLENRWQERFDATGTVAVRHPQETGTIPEGNADDALVPSPSAMLRTWWWRGLS